MRKLLLTLAVLAIAAPAGAQTSKQADPDDTVQGAALPAGWSARLDRAGAPANAVEFVVMGTGFHATMGPAAIFWNPKMAAKGAYRASGTFTQTKAPRHPEAYGLILGGRHLDTDAQDYLYFLVRQDGKFLVKHRAGAETHTLVDWTEHAAVNKADAAGKATNALRIDVGEKAVTFIVNGQEVRTVERVPSMNTDGLVGLRVNHNLDVHIADFAVEPASGEKHHH